MVDIIKLLVLISGGLFAIAGIFSMLLYIGITLSYDEFGDHSSPWAILRGKWPDNPSASLFRTCFKIMLISWLALACLGVIISIIDAF